MPRVRKGAARTRKHKKVLKSTRGYRGAASRRYRVAREAQLRAGQYAVIGRKLRKRDFRRLWITRISAACRQRGLSYSRFMHALSEKAVAVNRKVLADLAVSDPAAFDHLVAIATGKAAPPEAAKPAEEAVAAKQPPAAEEVQPAPPAEAPQAEADKETKPKRAARKAPAKAKPAGDAKPARKKPAAKKTTTKKTAARKTPAKKAKGGASSK